MSLNTLKEIYENRIDKEGLTSLQRAHQTKSFYGVPIVVCGRVKDVVGTTIKLYSYVYSNEETYEKIDDEIYTSHKLTEFHYYIECNSLKIDLKTINLGTLLEVKGSIYSSITYLSRYELDEFTMYVRAEEVAEISSNWQDREYFGFNQVIRAAEKLKEKERSKNLFIWIAVILFCLLAIMFITSKKG